MVSKATPIQENEVLSLKPVGLWTYPNPISAVPQGALSVATNTVIDRPNVIEQRRGVAPFGTVFSDSISHIYNYQNKLIVSHGTTLSYDSDGVGTWVDYAGSYSPPSGALTIHSSQANKNIYFSTSVGIKKLDLITGTIKSAGAPPGLDIAGSTTGYGWFTNSTQVAYRVLFAYTDSNNNLIQGAPSQRVVVSNSSGGATNVSLTFSLPAGLTTSWLYKIYRSPMSVDLNTEPNDELALVYTGSPASGDLTAGYITVTDSVSDALKGEFIYTASSQQGIGQANYQPPICTDFATFKSYTFYFNTMSIQQFFLTLISVGTPGLAVDATLTIGGITYTGKASETIASAQFQIFTGETPPQNITNTANSLVRVINRHASSTVYAYYQSGYADLPGKILLTTRVLGAAAFTVASSNAVAFTPKISTAVSSSNQSAPNRVFISKFSQPEAVPVLQYIDIGSADKAGLRIIPLRDYILLFKQDGVFQISGSDLSSFQASEVDKTLVLRGIETAVALNNKVYCFTNQTVTSVTFNEGAILKSNPIKKDLLTLSSSIYPNFDAYSFGVAYESDNKYILGTITASTDTSANQFYIYNYLTDAWTTWQFQYKMGCGFVNPTDDKLYLGSADSISRYTYQERKTFTVDDYADNSYPITITSSSGTTVVVNSTASAVVGYSLVQGFLASKIVSITDLTHLVVSSTLAWAAGAATLYRPISVSIKFVPESFSNPGVTKHFKEVHTIFSSANFESLDLGFYTDFFSGVNTIPLIPKIGGGWGSSWGSTPWGGGAPELQVIRGFVPMQQRRGHWLNLTIDYANALTNFALDGFALFYSKVSQRFR